MLPTLIAQLDSVQSFAPMKAMLDCD